MAFLLPPSSFLLRADSSRGVSSGRAWPWPWMVDLQLLKVCKPLLLRGSAQRSMAMGVVMSSPWALLQFHSQPDSSQIKTLLLPPSESLFVHYQDPDEHYNLDVCAQHQTSRAKLDQHLEWERKCRTITCYNCYFQVQMVSMYGFQHLIHSIF